MAELQVFEVPEPVHKQQVVVLEKAQKSGKIKIGVNETTKAVERGTAKLVIIAKDTDPKELVMHLPIICKEKNIAFSFANTKKELGEKAGIHVGTAALAVTNEGDAKKDMENLQKKLSDLAKKE
jgi:large subunit ribosomal protein L7Ae